MITGSKFVVRDGRHGWPAPRSPTDPRVSASIVLLQHSHLAILRRAKQFTLIQLFPLAIRHSGFRTYGASNNGTSTVLLVRSDLSRERSWRRAGLFVYLSLPVKGENCRWFHGKVSVSPCVCCVRW
jgi:hypothetical protein